MRYAQIRELDISNGEGVGVSLFVQGCHFHCKNCFNSETWDFTKGTEFTHEIGLSLLKLIDRPYIKRVSIIGGEPLAPENVIDISVLGHRIKAMYPDKKVWMYTGYVWEDIIGTERADVMECVDVLVDGRYIDEQRDLRLKFRGSQNQRVIDVQESLQQGKVILWCN